MWTHITDVNPETRQLDPTTTRALSVGGPGGTDMKCEATEDQVFTSMFTTGGVQCCEEHREQTHSTPEKDRERRKQITSELIGFEYELKADEYLVRDVTGKVHIAVERNTAD